MISVAVKNLTKRFGATIALDHLDLSIEAGEIFFLLGPSGCGKTTLLRALAGFVEPDGGQIFFDDEDVTRVPPHRRRTAMMFQSYALWPHLTVAKNVAFGLEERKIANAEIEPRVREALRNVRLENLADRRIHELSGGQQQRVALARALVVRPRCLLLDEPLSNLDAKLRQEMRGEIRRICKEYELTAIYVSHDQKEALSIADRIAILNGGHLEQIGAPGELYRSPRTKFVADFLGEANFLAGHVTQCADGFTTVATPLGALRGHATAELKTGMPALVLIRPEAWRLAPGENAIRGQIAESTYLGEMMRHRVLSGATELLVYEMNPQPRPDRELDLSAAPADVAVLPAA